MKLATLSTLPKWQTTYKPIYLRRLKPLYKRIEIGKIYTVRK